MGPRSWSLEELNSAKTRMSSGVGPGLWTWWGCMHLQTLWFQLVRPELGPTEARLDSTLQNPTERPQGVALSPCVCGSLENW